MNALTTRGGSGPLRPQTWEEMERFAAIAARSGMVPRDYAGKPEAVLIAVQLGSELGLPPMQSLQNIAVVNGRPSVWGDAMPALVRSSGLCMWIQERIEGEGDDRIAVCETLRRGDPAPTVRKFSVVDAKKAGLWQTEARVKRRSRDGGGYYEADNDSPWFRYQERMLAMRARSWCLRDAYPDVLKGLIAAEEAQDIPPEPHSGPTIEAKAEPVTTAQIIGDSLPPDPPAPVSSALPKKPTTKEWLDKLDMEMANAADAEAVDAILARTDVQQAQERLTNGPRERLQTILDAALKRTAAPAEDDDFPGVVTTEGE